MNKFLFIVALFCSIMTATAQKHDYNWIVGFNPSTNIINFNQPIPQVSPWEINTDFFGSPLMNIGYSDSSGNLLYFADVFYLRDKNKDLMSGSDSMIRKDLTGLAGHLALPYPGKPNHSCLIRSIIDDASQILNISNSLYLTEIDHTLNNGLGAVVLANKLLMSGKIYPIRACKHANGRDWWIITTDLNQSIFYTFLLDPSGISELFTQEVDAGPFFLNGEAWQGLALSPDGTTLVRYQNKTLAKYNFDRCTGLFTYVSSLSIASNYVYWPTFSPDGRMLYLSNFENLYACDMGNWPSEPEPIILYGNFNPNQPYVDALAFVQLAAAPNGKIYATPGAKGDSFHEVNRPNFPPFACDFRYRGLNVPLGFYSALPYYPNYRLGKVEGSTCDTIAFNAPYSDH
jgi:WD40-like Beta Propeller Repeat